MTKISKDELLKGEKIERVLSPHPLSFLKLQSLCIFLIIWGIVVWWLTDFSGYKGLFSGNPWYPLLLWGLILLLVGVAISLATIQWTIFFMYLAVFVGGVVLIYWQGWLKAANAFILVYSVAISIAGFLIIELYRRSYKYVLSNHRIIFKGGLLTKREKTIRYDKIITFDKKQGILGQLFGFGTITPITQSDAAEGKKVTDMEKEEGRRLRGIFFFSGDKEIRAELRGVYPYKKINRFVEELSQGTEPTQYVKEQIDFHKQQVDIQKQMRDILKSQAKRKAKSKSLVADEPEDEEDEEEIEEEEKPVRTKAILSKKTAHPKLKQDDDGEDEEEEEEPEEAFKPEQIDIQKQMKELLKKQIEVKDEDEEEEPDEKEELAEEEKKEDSKS